MLAMYMANQNDYDKSPEDYPEEEVDLDVRGTVGISGHHCYIAIGEIKTSPKCMLNKILCQSPITVESRLSPEGADCDQNVYRRLIAWALRLLFPEKIQEIVRVRRIFTSTSTSNSVPLPANSVDEGLSVYIHKL